MWHPLALGVTTVVVADGLGQLSVGISMCAVSAVTTLGVAALHFVWHAPLRGVGTESEKKRCSLSKSGHDGTRTRDLHRVMVAL